MVWNKQENYLLAVNNSSVVLTYFNWFLHTIRAARHRRVAWTAPAALSASPGFCCCFRKSSKRKQASKMRSWRFANMGSQFKNMSVNKLKRILFSMLKWQTVKLMLETWVLRLCREVMQTLVKWSSGPKTSLTDWLMMCGWLWLTVVKFVYKHI